MLVLTRKVHQSIVIGEGIEVVVLEVRGEQVRLGIRAPKDVTYSMLDLYLAARQPYPNVQFPAMGNHECTGATASNCGTAEAIIGEWNAPVTGRIIARRPASLAACAAPGSASRAPERTTC